MGGEVARKGKVYDLGGLPCVFSLSLVPGLGGWGVAQLNSRDGGVRLRGEYKVLARNSRIGVEYELERRPEELHTPK